MFEIPLLLGDGIGPEIATSTRSVLSAACAATGAAVSFEELPCGLCALDSHGTTMPRETLERLDRAEGWVLGPLSTHVYAGPPDQPNVSALLRKRYDLFANVRPVRNLLLAGPTPGRALDLVVVRENTQGFYADRNLYSGPGEVMTDADTALSLRLVTRRASENVARVAFALAEERAMRVTLVHKANVLRISDGLFLEACRAVAVDHPQVEVDDMHVDAAATAMITDPDTFDVIVTTNMFGDILSNEGAGLVGGLGLAPSLNQGADRGMAQASHGSAPSLAGTGTANPVALLLSGQMLLAWLAGRHNHGALADAARRVERAVHRVLVGGDPTHLTPDMGGSGSTATLTEAVIDAL